MIDINQPVKQGKDMILNYIDGPQELDSADNFKRQEDRGKLYALPPNDNPKGDVNKGDEYGTQLDLAK